MIKEPKACLSHKAFRRLVTQIACNMDFNYDILFDAFLAQVITTAYLNY